MQNRFLRVYVDETGDRGVSGRASRFFAFAAVLVTDEDEASMRAAISDVRQTLNVPAAKPLHWKEHVKTFARRQFVTGRLAALPVKVVYVLVEKTALSAYLRGDQVKFYNYAAGLILERVLLSARYDWPGGARHAVVRFGYVRGFDHRTTSRYFEVKAQQASGFVPYELLHSAPTFDGQANWDGLQVADAYAGMLHAAIHQDEYGGFEPVHLLRVVHQLRRGPGGKIDGYGWKSWVDDATTNSWPWWSASGIA